VVALPGNLVECELAPLATSALEMESETVIARLLGCRFCGAQHEAFLFSRRTANRTQEVVGAAGVAAPTTYVLLYLAA
jgi:hypothetical protein